jgi:hypothetical protein
MGAVAVAVAMCLLATGAFCAQPPHPPHARVLAVAHAATVPCAMFSMLSLIVGTAGWLAVATLSGAAAIVALWLLRAPSARRRGDDFGDGGGGGDDPPRPGGPTLAAPVDWEAFEREILPAWRAQRIATPRMSPDEPFEESGS